jgi:ADP-ribose pyrophosphatase YjhB (NUDIX family)
MKDDGSRMSLMVVSALAAASVVAAARRAGSPALVDEGMVGGHWGRQGVGVLLTTGRQVLLMLRSQRVLDPGLWGVPGGAVRVDSETGAAEDLHEAASKELLEEAGIEILPRDLQRMQVGKTVFKSGAFRYTTFIVKVPDSFTRRPVSLNWESDESGWMDIFQVGDLVEIDLLHPGVKFTLSKAGGKIFHG